MFNTNEILRKAETSSFYRWLLNWSVDAMIPFNRPHKFKVLEIGEYRVKTKIPYIKSNFNHIKGLHACSLATISEFTTGFLLVSRLDASKYRLIMSRLEMDYHYQGKMDATAEFVISQEWMEQKIYEPLKTQDAVEVICEVRIHDTNGNHLTTGQVYWHVKDWVRVKTKVG